MRNPLEPTAVVAERIPFFPIGIDVPPETAKGVHTSPDLDIGIWYAVARAGVTWKEKDDPNCGIVIALETSGLKALPDIDVEVYRDEVGPEILQEIFKEYYWLNDALSSGDQKELLHGLKNVAAANMAQAANEVALMGKTPSWDQVMLLRLNCGGRGCIFSALSRIPKEKLIGILRKAKKNKWVLPTEVWMDALRQRRYVHSMTLKRVIAIFGVRPVEMNIRKRASGEKAQHFTVDQILSGEDPEMSLMWHNPGWRAPREPKRVDFHGTDITRARKAFPEIEHRIKNPWGYPQE